MTMTMMWTMFVTMIMSISQEPEWGDDSAANKHQKEFETLVSSFAAKFVDDNFRAGNVDERASRNAQQNCVKQFGSFGKLHA